MDFLTISRRFEFIWTNIHLLRQNFRKHSSIIFFFLEYFSPFVLKVCLISRCFEKYYFQNFGIFVNFLHNFGCIYQKLPKSCKQMAIRNNQFPNSTVFRKFCLNKWILVQINSNLQEIVRKCIRKYTEEYGTFFRLKIMLICMVFKT